MIIYGNYIPYDLFVSAIYNPSSFFLRFIYRLNTSVTVNNLYVSYDTSTVHGFNETVKSFIPLVSIHECDNLSKYLTLKGSRN